MTDMTTIVKIKRKPDGSLYEITAEMELDRGIKSTNLKCADEPLASFAKALDALEVPVRAILQLDPAQWKGDLTITGVSFSRGSDGEGVVITASVDLSVAPLTLNTPNLALEHLAETAQKALEKVREEAQGYLDGKRKGDLFARAA